MLLSTAAVLTGGGLVFFAVGWYLDQTAIAFIGATIVLGTGVGVIDGLEVRDGATIEKNYQTVNNETVLANETRTTQRRPAPLPQRLELGFLITLAGGLTALKALEPPGGIG